MVTSGSCPRGTLSVGQRGGGIGGWRMSELPCVRGLVHVSGPHGVGKTTFALSAGSPLDMIYFDFERSAEGFVQVYPTKKYHNILNEFMLQHQGSRDETLLYWFTKSLFDAVPPNTYKVAVIDNASPLESSIVAEVEKYPTKYGLTVGQIGKMNQLVYGPAREEVRRLVDTLHSKGIPLVVVTTHLQDDYAGNQPSGLQHPRGMRTFASVSVLTLWLRPNRGKKVPSAMVLKDRLGRLLWVVRVDEEKQEVIAHGLEGEQVYGKATYEAVVSSGKENRIVRYPAAVPVPTLPRRLPVASWGAIAGYLETPANWDAPQEGEVPTEEELHLLNKTLTPEQLDMLRLRVLAAEKEAREQGGTVHEVGEVPSNAGELMGWAMTRLGFKSPAEIQQALSGRKVNEITDYQAAWEMLLSRPGSDLSDHHHLRSNIYGLHAQPGGVSQYLSREMQESPHGLDLAGLQCLQHSTGAA